jgi:hypothetical protein
MTLGPSAHYRDSAWWHKLLATLACPCPLQKLLQLPYVLDVPDYCYLIYKLTYSHMESPWVAH